MKRGSKTSLGFAVGRDSSHLRSPVGARVGFRRVAALPPTGPKGPIGRGPTSRTASQRPGLAALHLQSPVKHGIQVRTTSFLWSHY
jgi:hypothetical protein